MSEKNTGEADFSGQPTRDEPGHAGSADDPTGVGLRRVDAPVLDDPGRSAACKVVQSNDPRLSGGT